MAALPAPHPREPVFGDADYRDNDAYGIDCRDNLALRLNDYIVSVALVAVARIDGQPTTVADFSVSSLGVIAAGTEIQLPTGELVTAGLGQFVSWVGSGGVAGVQYRAWLAYTLASGTVLNRSWRIDIPAYVG